MKESEENLNSDFDLKVKHPIAEKLKSEPPAEVAPSPILFSAAEKKKAPLVPILGVILAVSLVINIILAVSLLSNSSTISILETEITNNEEKIKELRARLNESDS